ncbi:hypothetical protein GCK72_018859 [Caenorhabditis remanei]|uniref:5'-deoxynucleotidase HDDC2 n=1 Tax=Caenorhabditis remanei TaxID=31234 RepID=A0A6A5GCG7_CAERE|nr:hypothetical protein GCK72_018859 [Caenorhabditis remanei]KAF1752305.1 hypothetical protein GCK72_018859 [Caenorhabditis remanei]
MASSFQIFEILDVLDSLKHLKRTGWVNCGVPEPETVACHMYRMAVLAMTLEGQIDGLDTVRAVKMALVHDIAESIVGDITPHCGISNQDKFDLESQAIKRIATYVPNVGEEWIMLWREYEEAASLTARVVKHLDKFDMIAQAEKYEQTHGINLQQFFTSTSGVLTMEPFLTWDRELREKRNQRINQ